LVNLNKYYPVLPDSICLRDKKLYKTIHQSKKIFSIAFSSNLCVIFINKLIKSANNWKISPILAHLDIKKVKPLFNI
jgi:hypothetical protein